MASVPYSEQHLAESAAAFAEKITPAKARWQYCFERASFKYASRYDGVVRTCLNERTFPVCGKLVGWRASCTKYRLGLIRRLGIDGAFSWAQERDETYADFMRPTFFVGPMQAWHVGHLYFARVESHPHIVKIGFSRRVRDRLDDIENRCKTKLSMRPGEIRVGTLADEHWWHKNWSDFRISGEWFFDPHLSDRAVPGFLQADHQDVAA